MTTSPSPYEPRQKALPLWRGDDVPFVWSFTDTAPEGSFEGATILLIVQWGASPSTAGELTRSSEARDLVVDAGARTVLWTPTPADFSAITRGAPIRYELKRIVAGKVRTLAWGEMRLGSGLLRDPGEAPGPVGQSYTDLRVAALRSELLAEIADMQGSPGNGAASGYPHTQASPSAVWTIPHNLGLAPLVQCRTAGGVLIEGDVQHLSPNTLTVTFAAPQAGFARCA